MPYTTITSLPSAPSRSTDPDNFTSESSAWLTAIGTWKTQSNNLGDYIEALPLDVWNYGALTNPYTRRQITVTFDPPLSTDTPQDFTEKTDACNTGMVTLTSQANLVGAYADQLSAYSYPPVGADSPNIPVVSAISTEPSRLNNIDTFNLNFMAFYGSLNAYAGTLGAAIDRMHSVVYDSVDYSLITETVDSSEDFGSLT